MAFTVSTSTERHAITVEGVVQGVGFRPFVYALARDLGAGRLGRQHRRRGADRGRGPAPALARVRGPAPGRGAPAGRRRLPLPCRPIRPRGGTDFVIADSLGGPGRTLVSPDVATCDDCLAELADPADRRYRHPFISCTNCGPRFTVIVDLPYDRPATTMADLPLCADCAASMPTRPTAGSTPRPSPARPAGRR